MKDYELLDAVGGIDEKYIAGAMREHKQKSWIRWGALAACICLVAVAAFAGGFFNKPVPVAELDYDAGSAVQPLTEPVQSDNHEVSASNSPTSAGSEAEGYADAKIKIPAIKLPESNDGIADMIGCVVYKGNIYTQSGYSYYGDDAWRMDSIVGEYLGHAKGTIDEWSSQDEYSKEFASTYDGEIYAVKGYDTSFRICMRNEYTDDDGKTHLWIEVMDRLNGIGVTYGKDLYEDRLHLKGRIVSVEWQDHDDWNYARGNIQMANIEPSVLESFIDALCEAEFMDTLSSEGSSSVGSIYNTQKRLHLILTLDDGMIVSLQMLDEGYVAYTPPYGGWNCVEKIPDDIFNAVYNACGGAG